MTQVRGRGGGAASQGHGEPRRSSAQRVGIVGLGLMGGSLARSLKGLRQPPFIRAWSREPEETTGARRSGLIDETGGGFNSASFSDLDLLVYCTPLNTAMSLLAEHAPFLGAGQTVTDVASLKEPILSAALDAGLGRLFVGSHPLTGGEGSGFEASREGLFEGAKVWVVPGQASKEALGRVRDFWGSLGARAATIAADEHDVLMTWVSHLPQLTSNALAAVLDEVGLRPSDLGPGGKDMTRLAGSGPDMWEDLLAHAPKELLQGLRKVQDRLGEIEAHLRDGRIGEVRRILARTRRWTGGES